jgi:hypothetical protein
VASRIERTAQALGKFLSHYALQAGVIVLVLLVLFGSVPGGRLPLLLCLVVAGRSSLLVAEALRKRWNDQEWQARYAGSLADFRDAEPDDLSFEAEERGLEPDARPEDLARELVEAQRSQHAEPRSRRELLAEWIGLVALGLLFPFAFILFTRDIVSLRAGHGLVANAVAIVCFALYFWPHRWSPVEGIGERRSLWWVLPMVPALVLVYLGVVEHHAYLDPRRDDRVQLAAERVLELENNIIAGAHADWVFAYAAEVEARDEFAHAAALYRQGLQLAPGVAYARARLTALEGRFDPTRESAEAARVDPRPRALGLSAEEFAHLPLWDGERPLHTVPPCRVDASLESVPQTTVVIVPLDPVPTGLIEAVGHVLREELGLPSCRLPQPLPLPGADRIRGVVFGRQWNVVALAQYFYERTQPLPRAPLKFLLLTSGDLYSDGTNFVFSSSGKFGAVLSYARYGDASTEWETLRRRTAKQALGALLKSFELPPAGDPNCVTSYSNGLPQFDAKGNRPNLDTFLKFRARVDAVDERWRNDRVTRLGADGS